MDFLEKRKLILEGPMSKVILTLAVPVMISNFIQTIYNLTDTYFVSQLQGSAVAAVQFSWPLIFIMMALGSGFGIAGTSIISQLIGANDYNHARRVAGQIVWFALLFSAIVGVLGFFISGPLLKVMGASGSLLKYASDYIEVMYLGMPTMFMMFAYNSVKHGEGNTVTPMIISGLSVFMNIVLDPIFIFTLGLGVRGAAIATVLSRGVFGAYAIMTLFTKKSGIQLKLSDLKPDFDLLKSIISIGLPSSIGQSTSALGFAVLNVFIVSFGEATLTAFAIGNRISSLILMPAMGIGGAIASVIGQNLGAEQPDRAKKAFWTANMWSTLFLVIGGSFLLIISEWTIGLFTKDVEIASQGLFYMRLIIISLPLMGLFQILIGTFQGSGYTQYAMVMMIGRLWAIRIPLILVLKTFTDLGPKSVWYAMVFSNFIICSVGMVMYLRYKWLIPKLKKENIALDEA